MDKYHIPLHPGNYYHIFNHAIGDENLFRNKGNYNFFLEKYSKHADVICDTYAYSLLPNHFHFAIRIKDESECVSCFESTKAKVYSPNLHSLPDFIMERFSNLCNSYTKSYNAVFERKGALFIDFMKRVHVTTAKQFENLINYIHYNAVHHQFCHDPGMGMEFLWFLCP